LAIQGLQALGKKVVREALEKVSNLIKRLRHGRKNPPGKKPPKKTGRRNIDPELVKELERKGVKFDRDKLVDIYRLPNGKIAFLEEGNEKAGLAHIIKQHGDDFARRGVSEEEVPDLIRKALTEGKQVGMQGTKGTRPIYEVEFNGQKHKVAITVGSNGFIVGANPAG
jgi:hypothetical protein